MMIRRSATGLLAFVVLSCAGAAPRAGSQTEAAASSGAADPGLVIATSQGGFDETVGRLATALDKRKLNVFAKVDHKANAAGVDLELRPTTLFIFGNPKVGTQFMAASASMAIDLPMKMVVWQDEDGSVRVAYNDPNYLAQRHRIEGLDELAAKVSGVLGGIAAEAAGTAPAGG